MERELKNWRKYLTENKERLHKRYEANLNLAIEQSREIDRTDIMDAIRAIPEVTTVYREREVSTSAQFFVGEYILRFLLPPGKDIAIFYESSIKKKLKEIPGLWIDHDFGYEQIGVE